MLPPVTEQLVPLMLVAAPEPPCKSGYVPYLRYLLRKTAASKLA